MRNQAPSGERKVSKAETIPDLADVAAFCRVVDLGSVTAAARASGESKGTVSRRVSRLEEVLSVALLRRERRRVEPTEEGVRYREKAGAALELLAEASGSVRGGEGEPSGLLRLTAPPGVASMLLPGVLAPFLARWPAVAVEIVTTETVLSFRDHRIDIALRAAMSLPDSSLVAHRLIPLVPELVASPEYLTRRGVPQTPEGLADHDLLLIPIERGGQRLALQAPGGGRVAEVFLEGRVRSHDVLVLRDLALAGGGITGLLPHTAAPDLAAGRLVRVLPEWTPLTRAWLFLVHPGGRLSPKVRVFRDHVRAMFGEGCTPG